MATEMVLIPKTTYDRVMGTSAKQDQIPPVEVQRDELFANKNIESKHEPEEANSLSKNSKDQHERGQFESMATSSPTFSSSDKDNVTSADDDKESVDDLYIPTNIIEKFSERDQLYAKRLLSFIKKHGGKTLNWDDNDNAVVYNGESIIGSDIVELVQHLYKESHKSTPKGMKQFRKGLKEIGTPKAFIKPYLLKPPGISANIKKKWVKY